MQRSLSFFLLSVAALLVAYCVVVLGAYTRLSDAGLGCPDWPGCYGQVVAPGPADAESAQELYPDRPLHHGKALKEMVHRYAAGSLGILILGMALLGWVNRRAPRQTVWLPTALVGLVIFQALLGMWTVTRLLKPIIVTAHLLGGMTILALLFWTVISQCFHSPCGDRRAGRLLPWIVLALCVLAVQIFLGGWTSANYASLVCPDFPTCRGGLMWPSPDFQQAFRLFHSTGTSYEYGTLDTAGRTAIHLAHRAGALATTLVVAAVAAGAFLSGDRPMRISAIVVAVFLCAQVSLGIANVLLVLPLPVAVAHNGTAALLLLSLVALLHRAVLCRS